MSARERALDAVERTARITETVLRPGFLAAARHCRPFSIAARRLVLSLARAGVAPDVVVDVGANCGQFSAACLHTWPRAEVIAFEPLPSAATQLRAISGERLTVHQIAVGAHDGEVVINEHRYSPSSSALSAIGAPADEERSLVVPMKTLDTALTGAPMEGRQVLVKLDVQGFELEVLWGAPNTLAAAHAVVVEQAFEPTYQDQPMFHQVHTALEELGFSLEKLLDWRRQGGEVVEVDCLYRNRPLTSRSYTPSWPTDATPHP